MEEGRRTSPFAVIVTSNGEIKVGAISSICMTPEKALKEFVKAQRMASGTNARKIEGLASIARELHAAAIPEISQ